MPYMPQSYGQFGQQDPDEERANREALRREAMMGSVSGVNYGQGGTQGFDASRADPQAATMAQQYGAQDQGGSGGAMGGAAAMGKGKPNPWAIAAQVAQNYLKNSENKHRERRDYLAGMQASRVGQLGFPTYGVGAARLRYNQTFNRPGTVGYDPMG